MARRLCLLRINTNLKINTKIWGKNSSLINMKFDSEPVYGDGDKYIRSKLKSYGDIINKNLHDGKKKNNQKRYTMKPLVTDNARFC